MKNWVWCNFISSILNWIWNFQIEKVIKSTQYKFFQGIIRQLKLSETMLVHLTTLKSCNTRYFNGSEKKFKFHYRIIYISSLWKRAPPILIQMNLLPKCTLILKSEIGRLQKFIERKITRFLIIIEQLDRKLLIKLQNDGA